MANPNASAYNLLADNGAIIATLATSGVVELLDDGKVVETYSGWKDAYRNLTQTEPTDAPIGSKTMIAQVIAATGAAKAEPVAGESKPKGKSKKAAAPPAEDSKIEEAIKRAEDSGSTVMLDPDDVLVGKNPRGETPNPEKMAESLRKQADATGDALVQNIVVGPPNAKGKYQLYAGWTRAAAAKLNKQSYPNKPKYWMLRALVVDVDAGTAHAIGLRENLTRVDMNALAQARSFAMLVEDGWQQKSIAKEFGLSPAWVSDILRINEVKPLHKYIENGTLGTKQATEIAKLAEKYPEDFKVALATIKAASEAGHTLTTEEVKQAIRAEKQAKKEEAAGSESEETGEESTESAAEYEEADPGIVKLSRKEFSDFLDENTLPGADPVVHYILSNIKEVFNGLTKPATVLKRLAKMRMPEGKAAPDTGLINPGKKG
jgi:ParB/RepB/Spo0J family partition protein